MILQLALIVMASVPSSPLEGYEANFAKARVSVRYAHSTTIASPGVVSALWRGDDPGLDETATEDLVGEWAFDGAAEHLVFGSPNATADGALPMFGKLARLSYNVKPCEALFDDSIFVYGDARFGGELILSKYDPKSRTQICPGPFQWAWPTTSLPTWIRDQYKDVEPERRKGFYHGRVMEVNGYESTSVEGFRFRLDILYDPAAGFLPRMVRSTLVTSGGATVDEMHLYQFRPCSAGGFVPTDYYEAHFAVPDFASRYPDPTPESEFEPSGPITLGHFRVLDFRDQTGPVGIDRLERARTITSSGEFTTRFGPDVRPITMARIRATRSEELARNPPPASFFVSPPRPERTVSWTARLAELAENEDWPIYVLMPLIVFVITALALRRKGDAGPANAQHVTRELDDARSEP